MRHEEGRENTTVYPSPLWSLGLQLREELKQAHPGYSGQVNCAPLVIQPDMLLCRSERPLPDEVKEKIALFCDVDVRSVIAAKDVHSVYEIPIAFAEQGVDESILRMLHVNAGERNLSRWTDMLSRMKNPKSEVSIGLVGKYVEYEDSYKSLKEALLHAGMLRTRRA